MYENKNTSVTITVSRPLWVTRKSRPFENYCPIILVHHTGEGGNCSGTLMEELCGVPFFGSDLPPLPQLQLKATVTFFATVLSFKIFIIKLWKYHSVEQSKSIGLQSWVKQHDVASQWLKRMKKNEARHCADCQYALIIARQCNIRK